MQTIFNEDFSENIDSVGQLDISPYLLYVIHKSGGKIHGLKAIELVGKVMKLKDEVLDRVVNTRGRKYLEVQVRFSMSGLRLTKYFLSREGGKNKGFWILSKEGEKKIDELLSIIDKKDDLKNKLNELRSGIHLAWQKRREEREIVINATTDGVENISLDELEEEENEDQVDIESDLNILRQMNPFDFERLSVTLLKSMGAEIDVTQQSNDKGLDGIGNFTIGLITFKLVLQVKRFKKENNINETHIRDFLGAIKQNNAEKSVFITTSTFAEKARNLAGLHGITLIDGYKLIELLKENNIGYIKKLDKDLL